MDSGCFPLPYNRLRRVFTRLSTSAGRIKELVDQHIIIPWRERSRRRRVLSIFTSLRRNRNSADNREQNHNSPNVNPTTIIKGSEVSKTMAEIRCLTCTETKEKFPDRAFIQACRTCKNYLCCNCIRDMFSRAIKSQVNMPPRCCLFIPLHFGIPYISANDADGFRAAFEEFSTTGADRMYCPRRTCSTFIPKRLIASRRPKDAEAKTSLSCPKCKIQACMECKSIAHSTTPCPPKQKDIQLQTQLLKWGYKGCPHCGNWVRKMFGCYHMECLCGAHWCWGCQKPWDGDCTCYEDEESCEYDESDDVEDEERTEAGNQNGDTQQANNGNEAHDGDGAPLERQNERNLDAHAQYYWDQRDIYFGDEPAQDERARLVWNCTHSWQEPKLDGLEQEKIAPQVECHRCWRVDTRKLKCSECVYCGMVACTECHDKC